MKNNIFINILSYITYPIEVLTNWNLIKFYLFSILLIVLVYVIIGLIYCSVFKVAHIKYFQNTIFPIIGLFLLIIQGIIYIFFIPYHIFVVIIETFRYIIEIIKKIYNWLYNLINITLNIDDYILNTNDV